MGPSTGSDNHRRTRVEFRPRAITAGLLTLADLVLFPTIVLAIVVARISDSYTLVGLTAAVATGGWLLARRLALWRAKRPDRSARLAIWCTGLGAVALGALGILGLQGGNREATLLIAFFAAYAVVNLGTGLAGLPLLHVSGVGVPTEQQGFFPSGSFRVLGALALLAGVLIWSVLGLAGDAPGSYAILLLIAAAALALAAVIMARACTEAATPAAIRDLDNGSAPMTGEQLQAFRTFRTALAVAAIADPFYVLYAHQHLGAPLSLASVYVVLLAIGWFGSRALWSVIAELRGAGFVLQLAAVLRTLVPAFVLSVPWLGRDDLTEQALGGNPVLYSSVGLAFIALGMALGAQHLADRVYLTGAEMEQGDKPLLTALAIASIAPVIGGFVADGFGLGFLFAITFLIAVGTVMISGPVSQTPTLPQHQLGRSSPGFPLERREAE